MKPGLLILTLCGGMAVATHALADENGTRPACADGGPKVLVTGSAIKQCARFAGRYTLNTASPVFVISRGDIDHSGYSTTIEILHGHLPAGR